MIIIGIIRCFIYGKMPVPHLRPMESEPPGREGCGALEEAWGLLIREVWT